MVKVIKGIYNRRHPERTDYYRIIEANFDEFERNYPYMFEGKYGYLRAEVMKAIYAFLECGIPENGVARVRCNDCGDYFFVSFSCRQIIVCPCCSTKRSILFGEKVREIVKTASHIHITFTIPKILRAYFRRNRKLLKLLVQSANYAVEKYFKEALNIADGYTGGIFCVQSQGSLLNYHPHIHALVLAGITQACPEQSEWNLIFHEQTNVSTSVIAEIFRARLLTVLLEQGVITEELTDMLMTWNHNSGFNVHTKGRINGAEGDAIEKVGRYMRGAAISVERVEFNADENTVAVYERPVCVHRTGRQYKSPFNTSTTYTIIL